MATESETDIANMALRHLGISKEIGTLETENSQEANACRRFYDDARQAVLEAHPWPFATKYGTLVEASEDPPDEWEYSYRYPSDCLAVRRILSGARIDTKDSRVAYRQAQDSDGRIILTDAEDAEIEFTADVEDVTLMPHSFILAFSLMLASMIAPSFNDQYGYGAKALQKYELMVQRAMVNGHNEEQGEAPPDSDWVSGR